MSDPIRLTGLERHFQRGQREVQALRGIDLAIETGEFVALVGPSGSGKSTLLNLLGGLDRPSAGELWLDGLPLHSAGEKARTRHRRRRVGFIFQSFNLLPRLTALENVAVPLMLSGVGRAEREARARQLLQRVGLGDRLDHYPAEMSGGEQQRTAVARALIHNPTLVLADEPTGNLDSKTGNEVMALLQALNAEQGITLVVVTHDMEVASYANRIVRLRDGQVDEVVDGERPSSTPPGASSPSNPHGEAQKHNNPAPAAPETGEQGLKLGDVVQSAVRNLGRRPVRNILTAGGVLIGIITLVAMVSLGVGVQREVQRNFETIGLENIFVRPRFDEPDEFDPFAAPAPQRPITPEIVEQVEALPGVAAVTPSLSLPRGIEISLVYEEQSYPVRVSDDFGESRFSFGDTTSTVAGSTLQEGSGAGVVLITGLADRLLAPGQDYDDLLRQPITLVAQLPRGETNEFVTTIIGVRNGFGSRTIDLGIPQRAQIKAWWFGQPDILQTEGYDLLIVRATSLSEVAAVIEQIEDLDLQTQSLEAILEAANQVLALLQALLGSVGGLALLVAALGVANTMMMAIYERTREIGVLKALGASRGEIRSLFTVEAALIGLIGGVFGLIFGALLGRLVNWIAHRYLIAEGVTGVGQLSVVPLWLALGALAFAAFIGVLAGLYPAARAARLDPVTALRHE